MTNQTHSAFIFLATLITSEVLEKNEDGEAYFVTAEEYLEVNLSKVGEIELEHVEFEGEEYPCTRITFCDGTSVLVTEELSDIAKEYRQLASSLREMISSLETMDEESEEEDEDEEECDELCG